MPYSVTNRRTNNVFTVEPDETVLTAALREGMLFSYGCQAGSCGACKTMLIKGEVSYSGDTAALDQTDVEAGNILICQAVPKGDIEIDAHEIGTTDGIEIKTLPSRIREKTMLADDVVQLFLTLPKAQSFDFLPGQYLNVLLKGDKYRSFSIANTPEAAAEHGVELHIRLVEGGFYTPQVFDDATVKDIIRFQGPFGTYFLRTDENRPIIMAAGGTGFAPVKGLIEQAINHGLSQPIYLYWGARATADLYLDELAQSWAAQHDNIHYIPVLSEPDEFWQGRAGFVHQAILDDFSDFSAFSVYTSGPPVMVNAVRETFIERGLPVEHLYSDAFEYIAEIEQES